MPQTPDDIRAAVAAYYAAIRAGDMERVVAMFAAAAVMRDPVGTPAASTDAERRQRYGGIGAMFESFGIQEEHISASPAEAAARWTATGRARNGTDIRFEGISTFAFDDDGKITAMSAYWEPATIAAAFAG